MDHLFTSIKKSPTSDANALATAAAAAVVVPGTPSPNISLSGITCQSPDEGNLLPGWTYELYPKMPTKPTGDVSTQASNTDSCEEEVDMKDLVVNRRNKSYQYSDNEVMDRELTMEYGLGPDAANRRQHDMECISPSIAEESESDTQITEEETERAIRSFEEELECRIRGIDRNTKCGERNSQEDFFLRSEQDDGCIVDDELYLSSDSCHSGSDSDSDIVIDYGIKDDTSIDIDKTKHKTDSNCEVKEVVRNASKHNNPALLTRRRAPIICVEELIDECVSNGSPDLNDTHAIPNVAFATDTVVLCGAVANPAMAPGNGGARKKSSFRLPPNQLCPENSVPSESPQTNSSPVSTNGIVTLRSPKGRSSRITAYGSTENNKSDGSYCDSTGSVSSNTALLLRTVGDDGRIISCKETGLARVGTSGKALLQQTLQHVKRKLELLSSPSISFQPEQYKPSPQDSARKLRSSYIKNLVVLSLGFMLTYTTFFALRNLQSSIHPHQGLGLIALCCIYAGFAVGCLVATTIIHKIRPQRVLILSMFGHIFFPLANLYPTFSTMIPASLLLGLAMSTLWTAQGTYISSIGAAYSAVSGKQHEQVFNLFNGFFHLMVQLAHVFGSILSSTLLTYWHADNGLLVSSDDTVMLNRSTASGLTVHRINPIERQHGFHYTIHKRPTYEHYDSNIKPSVQCGIKHCTELTLWLNGQHTVENVIRKATDESFHILVEVLLVLAVLGSLLLVLMLGKLDVIFHRTKSGIKKQIAGLCASRKDRHTLLVLPLYIYLGLQEGLVYAEIIKVSSTKLLSYYIVTICHLMLKHIQQTYSLYRFIILHVLYYTNGTCMYAYVTLVPINFILFCLNDFP